MASAPARADDEAQLVVQVPAQSYGYKLAFQREGSGGLGSRVYFIDVKASNPNALVVESRNFAPGRYVLKYVMQQNAWIGCLEDSTYLIDLKPGQTAYLGTLDTKPTLAAIQAAALARGQMRGGGGRGGGIYHDVPRPALSGRAPVDLAALRANAPQVSLAELEDYRFRRADDRNRRKRACN